ncbi:MAG: methyltransferase domain-containing protein [archaeon]
MGGPKWNDYYNIEGRSKRFTPAEDPSEVHRANFALSLIPSKISSVLDAGCGDGYLCSMLKDRIASISGVDISNSRIDHAKRTFKNIDFKQGSIYRLPYPDASFDLVTAVEVIEHLEDISRAIREFARVSRKYVVITVPYKQNIREVICPFCLKKHNMDGHLHSFDENKLRAAVKESGLRTVKMDRYATPRRFEERLRHIGLTAVNRIIKQCLMKIGLINPDSYLYIGALCERI